MNERRSPLVLHSRFSYVPRPSFRVRLGRLAGGFAHESYVGESEMGTLEKTFDDLEEYRARVQLARLNASKDNIYNSSQRHASVLIEELITGAKAHVRIVCRSLSIGSYGSDAVFTAVEEFLDRGGKLDVVVSAPELDATQANPFIAKFSPDARVSIVTAPKVLALIKFDFLVTDGRSYRFESDHAKSVARANFNDETFAENLEELFQVIKTLHAAA